MTKSLAREGPREPEHVQIRRRFLIVVAAFALFVLAVVAISLVSDDGFMTIAPVVVPLSVVALPALALILPVWIGKRRYR